MMILIFKNIKRGETDPFKNGFLHFLLQITQMNTIEWP